ncbi:MAG: hypothetical protein MPJ78_19645 [Hyphomicrobiaceae bacterium]|nr:hypothetical protein [Hyphomicrobiaceae bacterium]
MTMLKSITKYTNPIRYFLDELFEIKPLSTSHKYAKRMAQDFPDEMNFNQAHDEYFRNKDFWNQFYYDGPFDFGFLPDREVPPDGNFVRPSSQPTRKALQRAVTKVIEARGREYAERMAHDFPDEMSREQAFGEFVKDPSFWRDFYERHPGNFSKGGETPPDGNFVKPERSFRQTPLNDIFGP